MLQEGYYTALGTPLDENGRFIPESFARQVDDQIQFNASGLLIMGSMGLGVYVRQEDYVSVARTGIEAAAKRCPVFVGATDTCIGRVCDRIDALKGLDIDGIVMTAPYYHTVTDKELIKFYSTVANHSPYPVYLYDLPVAARNKVTIETMKGLRAVSNIKGIKTADIELAHWLQGQVAKKTFAEDFRVLYSGLDTFDTAYADGVKRNLDGMFACTGKIAQKMYQQLSEGDLAAGSERLKEIIGLRDVFASELILPSFTYAMNLLGYQGYFHQDYFEMPSPEQKERVKSYMERYDLI